MLTETDALHAWVKGHAATLLAESEVERFVARVNGHILAGLPELAADPVLVAELDASTAAQWRIFLSGLDRDDQVVALPPQAYDLAISIAQRRLDLGVLLKVYRRGTDAAWDYVVENTDAVPANGPGANAALKFVWTRTNAWLSEAADHVALAYLEERQRQAEGSFAQRREAVEALLRGESGPIETVSREIGHQLQAQQTGFVVWLEDGSIREASAQVDSFALSVARMLGSTRAFTVVADRRAMWGWVATMEEPDLGRLRALVPPTGIQIAIGRPQVGIDGFRSSHREALAAQRGVLAVHRRSPVTLYEDVELECLLSGDPDGTSRLIARELGALAEADPALDVVRETLSHYLRNGTIAAHTSSALFVHPNTVRYRLAQAEQLIGHPISERRTEMDLALRCLAWRASGS